MYSFFIEKSRYVLCIHGDFLVFLCTFQSPLKKEDSMNTSKSATLEVEKLAHAKAMRPAKEKKNEFYYNPIWITDVSREWEEQLYLAHYRKFKAKEYIPTTLDGKGTEAGFYYLKHGKARAVYQYPDGKEVVLCHLAQGTLMYDLVAFENIVNYEIFAITPVEAYFFPADQFLNSSFGEEHPELLLTLIRSQALKNMYFTRRIVNISGGNAFANTCKLMLELSRSYGNALDVPLGVTHEEIASLLSVRRSWLGKILRRLKDEKVITKCTKARLVIADLNKLAAYAEV